MDKYFGHQRFCVKAEKTSRLGRIYEFKLPNGLHVSICRDMKTIEGWLGQWEVRVLASNKIHISSFMGHKSYKEAEEALSMLKTQTFVV